MTQPNPDRWQLGFSEAVKSHFSFVKQHGYELVQDDVTLIRYKSKKVTLNVYHGRSSYELGVEFVRVGFPRDRFTLFDLLQWLYATGAIDEVPTGGYQASMRPAIQALVAKISDIIRQYGISLLKGDVETYQALKEQQSSDAANYTREMRLRALRKQAEAAWRCKDYKGLLNLYSDMQGDLSPLEFRRFQYAETRLLAAHSGALNGK